MERSLRYVPIEQWMWDFSIMIWSNKFGEKIKIQLKSISLN